MSRLLGATIPLGEKRANTVLQVYELPLALFRKRQPELDPQPIVTVDLQPDNPRSWRGLHRRRGLRCPSAAELAALSD